MRRVLVSAVVITGLAVVVVVVFTTRAESVRLVPHIGDSAQLRSHWEAELARGVAERPEIRFANLSRQEFMKRLDRAAERYDFAVERVAFRQPKQLAPMVVVRSNDPFALAKDVPAVVKSLDPQANTGDNRTGWAWEGFYFEVQDHEGKPAIVIQNFWRERSGGGGQWAASESLYPFPHG
jgi:hypothetical protein